MRRFTIIFVAAVMLLGGCSNVKPWDRDLLAEKKMQLVPSPLDNALDEHIFFSKEAASGGQSTGGGGCGCN
jgi:hypothetical protein